MIVWTLIKMISKFQFEVIAAKGEQKASQALKEVCS